MPTKNKVTNENLFFQQIETFGKIFEEFMQSKTPRKLLNELDLNWHLLLLKLEKEQRENREVFEATLDLLRTKLDLIYEKNNYTLGASAEVLNGDVHFITYEIMATTLFKIRFMTDSTLGDDICYFDYREYSKSLIPLVNEIIGPNVLEQLKKPKNKKYKNCKPI